MLSENDLELILTARHNDPFAVLGMHAATDGTLWVRAFLPGATAVEIISATTGRQRGTLGIRHEHGFFEGPLKAAERFPTTGYA